MMLPPLSMHPILAIDFAQSVGVGRGVAPRESRRRRSVRHFFVFFWVVVVVFFRSSSSRLESDDIIYKC